MTRRLLALLLVLSLAGSARALPPELEYAAPVAPAAPDPAGLVLRLVGMTAGLLVLCAGVLWFARRAARPAGLKGDGGGRLRHQGSLALGRHGTLHLLLVDGQTVAVTTDATGLRSLVVLSEPFEEALAAAGAELPPAGEP
jgi:hypothetical protein